MFRIKKKNKLLEIEIFNNFYRKESNQAIGLMLGCECLCIIKRVSFDFNI